VKLLFLLTFILFFNVSAKEVPRDGLYRYVQVLAIRDFSRANKLLEKLESNNYKYVVRGSSKNNELYHRVVVGPFLSSLEAKEEQKKLEKLLHLKSSFILTYESPATNNIDQKKSLTSIDTDFKKRVDNIVQLSFTRESFLKNKTFVCKELNFLVEQNYSPALILLASNYIKGDECVEQNFSKAIDYLILIQKQKSDIPENLIKFSKELLAETYLKTLEKDNFTKAKKVLEELLTENNDEKYNIYLYKRLAYIEYFYKEYKAMNIWLNEAANLGDIQSQLNLGKNYFNGLGLEKDIKKSIYWFDKCSEKNKECAETLGDMYLNINLSISPDLKKAFNYYEKALNLGSLKAKQILEGREKIEEFHSLMLQEELQYKLIEEHLLRYLKDKSISDIFISNINKKDNKLYEVFLSFSMDKEDKVAKIIFKKNSNNYWIAKEFNISDSILKL